MKKFSLAKYRKPIQWSLALCCIFYIITVSVRDSELLNIFRNIRPLMVVVIVFFYLMGQVLTVYRFQLVLEKSSRQKLPYGRWFRLFVLGNFLNQALPQSGNIYRSMILKRHHAITYTKYIAGFFSFTWMSVCLSMIFAIIVVAIFAPGFCVGHFRAIHVLPLLIAFGVGCPIILRYILPPHRSSGTVLSWTRERFSEILHISVHNLKDPTYMFKFFLSGVLLFANSMAQYYFSFYAFGIKAGMAPLALFLVVIILSNRVVLTPGNLGLRELAFGIASDQMSIGMTQGILVSAIIRVIGIFFTAILGIIFGGITLLKTKPVDSGDESYRQ